MSSQIYTEEEFANVLRFFTTVEEAEQLPAVAPIPSRASTSPFGNYPNPNVDLDGAPPSIFEPRPGQIHQGAGDLQGHLAEGQAQDFRSGSVNPGFTPYPTNGLGDTTPQGQPLRSCGSGDQVYTPHTIDDGLQNPPTVNATATPLPPTPAGINPHAFAGALHVATTTAAGPSENRPTITSSLAPPRPQRFYYNNPSHPTPTPTPTTTSTTTTMVAPYQPPPPPANEYLSDYPHLHRTHHTTGYRDGLTYARHQTSQPAFDAGFPIGMDYGHRVGRVLGILLFALSGSTLQLNHEVLARARRELEGMGLWRDSQIENQMSMQMQMQTQYGTGVGNMAGDLHAPGSGHEAGNGYGNAAGYWNANANPNPNPNPNPNINTAGPSPATALTPYAAIQGQTQLPQTMQRFGPPYNFNFYGPNDPNLYNQPMPRLTADEAIRRWEAFATGWMQSKCNRIVGGVEAL